MNKKVWLFVSVVALLIGCNDELKVNADWKDVSIIYGVLDKTQSSNYVRIHRGYLGNEGITGGNQNPDSLYYPSLSVSINLLYNGEIVKTIELKKDESLSLDTGFFTSDQYHTYRLDRNLNGDDTTYQLWVDKEGDNLEPVYAETPIVEDFEIRRPRAWNKLSFAPIAQKLEWYYAENGRMYQAIFRMHYLEMQRDDHSITEDKYVDYVLPIVTASDLSGTASPYETEIAYESYYNYLYNAIGVNTDVIRFYQGTDLKVAAVADDLATYMNINAPANTVIQDKPEFTNIMGGSGANAGIFSASNAVEYVLMELSDPSFDSLVFGNLTCDLQFARPWEEKEIPVFVKEGFSRLVTDLRHIVIIIS